VEKFKQVNSLCDCNSEFIRLGCQYYTLTLFFVAFADQKRQAKAFLEQSLTVLFTVFLSILKRERERTETVTLQTFRDVDHLKYKRSRAFSPRSITVPDRSPFHDRF
jgi:hypothetical protein